MEMYTGGVPVKETKIKTRRALPADWHSPEEDLFWEEEFRVWEEKRGAGNA